MSFTDKELRTFAILCSTISPLVITVIATRLYVRYPKFEWEEGFAVFGACCMLTTVALFWASFHSPPHAIFPIFTGYFSVGYLGIYAARFSILMSVYKLTPRGTMHNLCRACVVILGICVFIVIVQLLWYCETHQLRFPNGVAQCSWNLQLPIMQITLAVVCDTFLVVLPLRVISVLDEDSPLKPRLITIFAASAITSMFSIANSVACLLRDIFVVFLCLWLELWVALILCNSGIIVAAIMKRFSSASSLDASELGSDATLCFRHDQPSTQIGSICEIDGDWKNSELQHEKTTGFLKDGVDKMSCISEESEEEMVLEARTPATV